MQLAAARLLLTAVLLVGVVALARRVRQMTDSWRQPPTWWAGVGQVGFNLCFLGAVDRVGVAVGTLVAIGATPVLTGLVTRQVSRAWLLATATAVCGLVLLVGGQARSESVPSAWGILLALGASASYATYIIAGNAAAVRRQPIQPFLAGAFAVSAVLTVPLLFTGDVTWVGTGSGALLVAYLAVVPTVVAYSLFNRGLQGIRPSTASTLGLLEPVVAAGLAVLVVGERLSPLGAGGALLVIVGLLMIVRTARDSSARVAVGENAVRA